MKSKYFIISAMIFLTSLSLSAQTSSPEERRLLCKEVESLYQSHPEAELYLGYKKCLTNNSIQATSEGAAQTKVSGDLIFYRSGVSKKYYLEINCQITYIGKANSENVNREVSCGHSVN